MTPSDRLDRLWLSRNIVAIGILLIVTIMLIAFITLWDMRQATLRDAQAALRSKGVAIAEQTARAVQAADLVLQDLEQKVTAVAADRALRDTPYLLSREFQQDMHSSLRNLPQVDGLSVTDPDGKLLAFSREWPAPSISLADRDLYFYLRYNDDHTTFVSRPVRNRATKEWTFFLARRVDGLQGEFRGIVIATIPLSYFEDFYKAVTGIGGSAVSMVRRDGVLMTRFPEVATLIGKPFPSFQGWFKLVEAGGGEYEAPGTSELQIRLVSVNPLQLYPLVVDVTLSKIAALAPWRTTAIVVAVVTLLTCLGFGLLFALLAAQFRAMDRQRRDLIETTEALARSERLLQESARDLETTLAAMDEGVMMVNQEGRVVVCNSRAMEVLDLPRALMETHPTFDRVLQHQWETNEFVRMDKSLLAFIRAGGLSQSPKFYERVRPNGTILEIRTTTLPGGGMVRTYLDITERRAAEQMRAAVDEADRASRAKSEFLATMSHEIRSPMSGLLGVLELLRASELDPEQRRMAEMVHNSGSILLAVLNDILDFSKIEAGALTIQREPTQLRPLLADLVQPHALAASQKGLAVSLSLDAGVPDWISIDPLRLNQIVGNLLSNAIKFTAAGEIGVQVDVHENRLRLTVRDSGIGMSEAVQARLFNPFTQAEASTARTYGGTGLGLAISRKLAVLLDGELTVASRLGEGSVFTLLLPLLPCDAADRPGTADDPAPDVQIQAGRRVLVIDDDPTIRWLSQRQLETLGCRAEMAGDGTAALQKLRNSVYDLVLTDCHMPGIDGPTLTRAIRTAADPALRGLPIIGLTADVTEAQRRNCLDAGMTDLAIKPLTLVRLSQLLSEHLSASPAPALPAAPALRAMEFDDQIYLEIFPRGDPDGAAWLRESLDTIGADGGELGRLVTGAARGEVEAGAIATLAHRMAGAAFSIGAILLGEAARALERAAIAGEMDKFAPREAALQGALAAATQAIIAFLSDAPAEAGA